MKEQGFCIKHLKNKENVKKAETEKVVIFNLYLKQLLVWVFKVYADLDKEKGIIFLYHVLKYLTWLNKSSIYYNELTTQLLFSNKPEMMIQLF